LAIYSYSMRARVSRGAGKSSVGAAAYLCREQMRDQRTGQIYDWRQAEPGIAEASAYIERSAGDHGSRQELLYSGLYGPAGAPAWTRGREHIKEFWNRAEAAERHGRAQVAERIIIALPAELTIEQNVRLLQDHVRDFTRQGRVVQVAIHSGEQDRRNIHAHLLISTRGVDEDGFRPTKTREQQERFLNRRDYVSGLRASWEHAANRHLERHGLETRIDRRTLAAQGIDREPGRHMGPAAAWPNSAGSKPTAALSTERERSATLSGRHAGPGPRTRR
jgi:hypothetical protein